MAGGTKGGSAKPSSGRTRLASGIRGDLSRISGMRRLR